MWISPKSSYSAYFSDQNTRFYIGFRWLNICVLVLWTNVASTLEGLYNKHNNLLQQSFFYITYTKLRNKQIFFSGRFTRFYIVLTSRSLPVFMDHTKISKVSRAPAHTISSLWSRARLENCAGLGEVKVRKFLYLFERTWSITVNSQKFGKLFNNYNFYGLRVAHVSWKYWQSRVIVVDT